MTSRTRKLIAAAALQGLAALLAANDGAAAPGQGVAQSPKPDLTCRVVAVMGTPNGKEIPSGSRVVVPKNVPSTMYFKVFVKNAGNADAPRFEGVGRHSFHPGTAAMEGALRFGPIRRGSEGRDMYLMYFWAGYSVTFTATLDPKNQVSESNKSNNVCRFVFEAVSDHKPPK